MNIRYMAYGNAALKPCETNQAKLSLVSSQPVKSDMHQVLAQLAYDRFSRSYVPSEVEAVLDDMRGSSFAFSLKDKIACGAVFAVSAFALIFFSLAVF